MAVLLLIINANYKAKQRKKRLILKAGTTKMLLWFDCFEKKQKTKGLKPKNPGRKERTGTLYFFKR